MRTFVCPSAAGFWKYKPFLPLVKDLDVARCSISQGAETVQLLV